MRSALPAPVRQTASSICAEKKSIFKHQENHIAKPQMLVGIPRQVICTETLLPLQKELDLWGAEVPAAAVLVTPTRVTATAEMQSSAGTRRLAPTPPMTTLHKTDFWGENTPSSWGSEGNAGSRVGICQGTKLAVLLQQKQTGAMTGPGCISAAYTFC